ncbi:MAG: ABC transporter [Rhodospirillales bacterium 20-64-7]|nr:MAG: ABC transporter [Rhodospirillales bacterium 20-64-7]HQT78007.1 ABC transporter ATP-binding protein [Rhodopila sp.]
MHFDIKLWRMTAGLRGRIAWSAGLGLAALVVGIARFVFLGQFLAGVFRNQGTSRLLPPLCAAAAAILLRAVLDYQRAMVAHRTAARVQAVLRGRLFDRIIALGPAWFGAERTGGVMLSMVDGVEQLQSFFGQYLPQVTIAVCAPVAIFAFIAWWDIPVAAVMLAAALFTLILPATVHRRTAAASRTRQAAFKSFGEEFLDAVQGLPTLKAFGQSAAYGRMLAAKARALSDSTFWVLALNVLTRGFTDLGTALGSAAALALGAWRVRHGDMSLEALLIVLMAGTEIFRPLRDLRAVLHQGMTGQAAAAGINALLDTPAEVPSEIRPPGIRRVTLTPGIVFDQVRFGYPGGRRATYAGLSFTIGAGERVGVVGPSGAGKSTIIRLLTRLYAPQGGRIRIGGHDLQTVDPAVLHDMIAVVSQDTYLFHGSVEENLRLGAPDATEADVIAAAVAANAHAFIVALPDGYHTIIGERGTRLSGGQRQRLAIARALLRDAPILVLDEALSSVDAENESIIQQALDRLMRGRTTLILAHRLSSVIGADRILVLNDGVIVQAGHHQELIGQPGPYRDLMAPQLAETDHAHVAVSAPAPATPDLAAAGTVITPMSEDAAHVTWPETIRTLLRVVRPYHAQLAVTVLCGIGRVIAFIGVSVLGALVLGAVRDGAPTATLVTALLLTAPLAGLLHWLESWIAHAMAYALLADMRIDLFRRLDALAPAYLLRRRSGDLVALATQDVETVEYFFAHTIAPAVVAVLVPVGVLAALAWFAWPLALVLAPFLGYAAAAPFLGRQRIDSLGSAARGALGGIGAYTTETIQGLAELVMFGATRRRRDGFMQAVRTYQEMRLRLLADLAFQSSALDAATGLGGLAVAALGAVLVLHGMIVPTVLPLLVLLATAAFLPVSEIAQVGRQLADTIASVRRLHVVQVEPVPITDGPRLPAATTGGASVTFDRVGFVYPGRAAPALRDVSFAMPPGSTVALVGPSGAGKTTVANLLLRFWDPSSGTIRFDGIDLRALSLDGLRGRIALVAQDTYLFNDTLEANVRLARPDATPAQIDMALSRAALADFVAGLPDGLATRVGERGVQLSGGQRQRIAIARAFLKDAPLLILDEATSHLDTINEQAVRRALDALMADRTTMVIAHRLSTIRAADLILVLRDGQVVESGTHDALLAERAFYAQLVEHQLAAGVIAASVRRAVPGEAAPPAL